MRVFFLTDHRHSIETLIQITQRTCYTFYGTLLNFPKTLNSTNPLKKEKTK